MENKTLLNETLESGMESLKTMKPGSEEYAAAVNSLAKLHEMQMNETAEENSKTAKEDELQLKWQQVKADVQKADSDRRVEILKTVGGHRNRTSHAGSTDLGRHCRNAHHGRLIRMEPGERMVQRGRRTHSAVADIQGWFQNFDAEHL